MITPEDERRIEDLIAQKFDLMSAFRDLPDADRESIANDISAFLYSRQMALRKPENTYTPRWTQDGDDINLDDSAVGKGHTGPTMPRWIDHVGGASWLDSDDPQILHFQSANSGPCYDIYLDPDGHFEYPSTQTPNNRFSNLQAAINYAEGEGFTRPVSVWVCPNPESYGDGQIFAEFAGTDASYTFSSASNTASLSPWVARLGSITVSAGLTFSPTFVNIVVDSIVLERHASATTNISYMAAINSRFGGFSSSGAGAGATTIVSSRFIGCTLSIGNSSTAGVDTLQAAQFAACSVGSVHAANVIDVEFDASCELGGGGTGSGYAAFLRIDRSFRGVTVKGQWSGWSDFSIPATCVLFELDAIGAPGSSGMIISVLSTGSVQGGSPLYFAVNNGGDPPQQVQIIGCAYELDSVYIKGALGEFTDSTFGPCAPDDLDWSGVTGTGNVFYTTGSVPAGAPPVGPTPDIEQVLTAGDDAGGLAMRNLLYIDGPPEPLGAGSTYAVLDLDSVPGQAALSGAYNPTFEPAAFIAPPATAAHGKAMILTDNSVGGAGEVLTADGAGTATWEANAAAPSDADYLTYSDESATLPNSKIWTPGSGIGGAGTPASPAALGILTADWNQTGLFDILHSGAIAHGNVAAPVETITIGGVSISAISAAHISGIAHQAGLLFTQHNTAVSSAIGPVIYLAKSRGSYTAQTAVASSDILGGIRMHGFDGTDYEEAAAILSYVDGTPGSGDMPGRLTFWTTPDGTAAIVERMRITNAGNVRLANYLSLLGVTTAPTNTTDGDFTAKRLIVPDAAILHSAITQLGGPVVIPTGGKILFSDADDSNYVGLRSPAVAPAANLVIHLPSDTPSAGEFLKVTAFSTPDITTEWAAGGGGGASAMDDLTDADTTTTTPTLSDVLKWNGTNWVPAAYNYSFTFSIATFVAASFNTGGTRLIGLGDYLAIGAVSLTATYNNMPGGMTAAVALTGSPANWSGLALAGAVGPTVTTSAIQWPTSRTGSLTLTLTQSADGTTATCVVSFQNTARYGTNANGQGAQTEANIEALTEVGSASAPDETRTQTISNIPTGTAGHFLTIAHASALSSAAQIQADMGFGFVTASFAAAATTLAPDVQTSGLTTITNSLGFIEAFKAYTARLASLTNGTNDFKLLTSSTAQNYFYWGELNKASGYTEADVEGNYATQPGKVASNTVARSCIVNCAAGEYAYIAYPARLAALTSILIGGFESIGDFTVDNTALAITNDAGYQENYRVYVSNNPSFTNPTTMVIS